MKAKSEVRIVPGAETAVLLIHGIVGTPKHFVTQIPLVDLIPEEWSVYNLLLDGHGGTIEDFAHTSRKKWSQQVRSVFQQLSENHDRVILVGHSMGTLFSLQLAKENPEKIPAMLLLAVPLWPKCGFLAMNCSLRLAFNRIREDKPREVGIRGACGTTPSPLVWRYIPWIPRFLDLFYEIYKTHGILSDVQARCVVFQSRTDELVCRISAKPLNKLKKLEFAELQESGHFHYSASDTKQIRQKFSEMLDTYGGN